MGFKATDRCLSKVDDDEPIFVLRAQDALSLSAIHYWMQGARETLTSEHIHEIRTIIDEFAHWQQVHASRVKRPD